MIFEKVQASDTAVWEVKLLFQKRGWLWNDQKREMGQQKKFTERENSSTQTSEAASYVCIRCKERAVVSTFPDATQSPHQPSTHRLFPSIRQRPYLDAVNWVAGSPSRWNRTTVSGLANAYHRQSRKPSTYPTYAPGKHVLRCLTNKHCADEDRKRTSKGCC